MFFRKSLPFYRFSLVKVGEGFSLPKKGTDVKGKNFFYGSSEKS